MNPMISVIVAIYQVAPFLRECLESIRLQSYRNLDVILVDDGSSDGSEKICDEYVKKDVRFRVIHQENQGVARARKNGVRIAEGPYIGFVDGDDWIEADMYERLLQSMLPENADVAVCLKNIHQDSTGCCYAEDAVAEEQIYRKENGMNRICDYLFWGQNGHKEGISISLHDKLFRRERIGKYMETVDERLRYCEDSVCVVPCLMEADTVVIVNAPLYNYRKRTGSACNSKDIMYLEQFNIFYKSIVDRLGSDRVEFKQRLDKYFVSRIYEGMNKMMGLSLNHVLPLHVPPLACLLAHEKIVIYGAGVVGRDYYRMMELMCPDQIAGWVDRQWEKLQKEGLPVEPVHQLLEWNDSKILIAALFADGADRIKRELLQMGIAEKQIFWRAPGTVLD